MRGVYTANEQIAALNPAAGDTLLLIEVPSDLVIEILSASITNLDNDTNEQLEAGLFRVATKGTPAGNAVTPQKHEDGDAASSCTVLGAANGGLSTEPTAYDGEPFDLQGFSNLAGYRYDPIPEERPIVKPADLVGLRLMAAPSAAFKASVQVIFREIG